MTNKQAGTVKYDAGKAPIRRGVIDYFPNALAAVATVSAMGAAKYAWGGWRGVEDGIQRYGDAEMRHATAQARGELVDPESGMLHAAHEAWNALARLELIIKAQGEPKAANDPEPIAPKNDGERAAVARMDEAFDKLIADAGVEKRRVFKPAPNREDALEYVRSMGYDI